MLDAHEFQVPNLSGLSPETAQAVRKILDLVSEQTLQISRKDQEIKFKDAKLQKLTFELARHKAWRFGAKTERMNAEQRQMFEDTLAEDQASLEAQLAALKSKVAPGEAPVGNDAKRSPRRQALPDHLRRVVHHHELGAPDRMVDHRHRRHGVEAELARKAHDFITEVVIHIKRVGAMVRVFKKFFRVFYFVI